MNELSLLKAVPVYAWGVFMFAWIQMGWADWTQQKIRNRYLTLWLKFIAAGYLALIGHTVFGELGIVSTYLFKDYYLAVGGYLAVSASAAYVLWVLRIWPAGDVKLFTLLALCYGLMRLPGSFHSGLRTLEVLINVFIPAAAFLFVTASEYLWRTRFNEQKKFYVELGARRAASYLAVKAVEAWEKMKVELPKVLAEYREPRKVLADVSIWLSSMAVMSVVSYYLNDVIRSNFLKTLFCFALFYSWSRFSQMVGKYRALGLTAAIFGILLWRAPTIHWGALAESFGHITIFSFCIMVGIQLAFKVAAGQIGFLVMPLMLIVPSLVPLLFLVPGWISNHLKGVSAAIPPPVAAAWGIAVWAGMGLFFGLSLVFVRIWDAESYKSVSPDQIKPFMNLGPSIVERLEMDPEFCEEHFHTLYADGITPEQAQALAEWCVENKVDSVPLAPTISFANWIFLGYFLTLLLNGHVLKVVY